MSITIYEVAVPMFVRGLKNLKGFLQTAEENIKSREIDPAVILNGRLAPDMFPLTRQVQIATDFARRTCARLAGQPVSSTEDSETTFDQLYARIDTALDEVRGMDPGLFENAESREITLEIPGQTLNFSGLNYLQHFALPNFQFHMTTAYAILRHNGVPLGKRDYLGAA